MSFTQAELDALERLPLYADEQYDPVTAPQGFGGEGYFINIPASLADISAVGTAIARETDDLESSVTAASASAANALTSANNAALSEAVCVGAATSVSLPFATTSGTGTSYTVDLTPNAVIADGFAARINFHTSNAGNCTIAFDGGAGIQILDGSQRSSGGSYRILKAGEITTGMNLLLMYDSGINKFLASGLALSEISKNVDFLHNSVVNAKRTSLIYTTGLTFQQNNCNNTLFLQPTADAIFILDVQANAAISTNSEIEFFNDSDFICTMQINSGVIVNGVNGGAVDIDPYKGGMFKKISNDRWAYVGYNSDALS